MEIFDGRFWTLIQTNDVQSYNKLENFIPNANASLAQGQSIRFVSERLLVKIRHEAKFSNTIPV